MAVPRSVVAAALGLVLMFVGAFGPWAKVLGVLTIHGTDDSKDGWVVVGAGIAAVIFLLIVALTRLRWFAIAPLLAGGVAIATTVYDVTDINRLGGGGVASAQWGIYLALAGSIVLALASVWVLFEVRRTPPAAPAPTEPTPPAPS